MSLRKLVSVDLGLAVEGNARTENMKFSRTVLHFSVCLGSLRASRERLNGQNLAADAPGDIHKSEQYMEAYLVSSLPE